MADGKHSFCHFYLPSLQLGMIFASLKTMKRTIKYFSIITIVFVLSGFDKRQTDVPWDATNIVMPDDLSVKLNDPKAVKPVIICVGPVEKIKTALLMEHPAASLSGIEDLKYALSKFSKKQEIILYCGCCKLKTCPNIKPAFEFLRDNGYTGRKVLYLPNNLDEDWVEKGYPMEK